MAESAKTGWRASDFPILPGELFGVAFGFRNAGCAADAAQSIAGDVTPVRCANGDATTSLRDREAQAFTKVR